jgi:hypothetical protein
LMIAEIDVVELLSHLNHFHLLVRHFELSHSKKLKLLSLLCIFLS